MVFKNIRIVLVEPTIAGNIGATARAMKNMGFARLYLVNPKQFPHPEAFYRCSGADDILNSAKIVSTFDEAVSDCCMVIGTSARERIFPQPLLNPREAAEIILKEPTHHEIAIVFGPEPSGLDNDILRRCHYHIMIPSVLDFSSLNLAMAVQVIVYEMRMHFLLNAKKEILPQSEEAPLATMEELEGLYGDIEKLMIEARFFNPKNPRKMMPRLRRLFGRARLDRDDYDLLRGMFRAIGSIFSQK